MAEHEVSDVKSAMQEIVPSKVDSEAARTSAEWAAGDIANVKLQDNSLDPALRATGGNIVHYSEEDFARVLKKIDTHVLPLMCWIYMIQFADKSSLNYSSLMGIKKDNHLDGYQYSWLGSIFYAGYIFWEFPTMFFLRRLPLGKYLSVNIICWGVVLSCHAATSNWAGLMISRCFLGGFEATITPGFVLITSMWYKQNEQARRMGYWLACNGAASILGSLIAYGLSAVNHAALAPWKILFLLFGLVTVVTGFFYLWYMPDNQLNAMFLTEDEKLIAIERIRDNFQGIGNRVWKWNQFWEALRDPRTWLYGLYSLLMNIPNGGITVFGGVIIKSFGFDSRVSLLLSAPGGAVDIIAKLLFPWLSDYFMDRSLFSFIAILFPTLGCVLMTVVPLEHKGPLLFGNYLISVAGASWCLVMVLISNNTLGYTKKATVNTIQILGYAAGNWIGPQTFRSNDAPLYHTGKTVMAILYGCSALVLVALRVINIIENKRRDKAQAESGIDLNDPEVQESIQRSKFMDLTDYEQPHFRYIL